MHIPNALPALCICPPANLDGQMKKKSTTKAIILLLLFYTEQVGESARFYTRTREKGGSILFRDTGYPD
jgi:hypothetical protein